MSAAFGGGFVAFYRTLVEGPFGSWGRLLATFAKVSPLVLTGLAAALPLKGGLFNIGAQGQMYAGALAAMATALVLSGISPLMLIPLVLLVGTAAGAGFGAIAGRLKSRYGVHEVISTIMLNFIALQATAYLVSSGPLASPEGLGRTPPLPEAARLPIIAEAEAYPLSISIFIACAAAVVAWWFVSRSVTGFRMRAAGRNALAATRRGISVPRMITTAMALGGACAGLAGATEVAGVQYSVSAAFSTEYGFDGIAVALLANGHPLGVLPAAFLFGALRAAGTILQRDTGLSAQMIFCIEAVVIIAAAIPAVPRLLARWRPIVAAAACEE